MARQLRQDRLEALGAALNSQEVRKVRNAVSNLVKELPERFLNVKDAIEDWQSPSNYNLLKNRLATLAGKANLTENNIKDIAIIAVVLWNIEEV